MTFESIKYRTLAFPTEYTPDSIYKFTETLRELCQSSHDAILIDCQQIKMVYSGGLGILINAYKFCTEKEIYFGVVNVSESLTHVLHSTNLNKILNIFSTILEFEVMAPRENAVNRTSQLPEFTFETKTHSGIHIYICKGIMSDGVTFQTLRQGLELAETALLDFGALSYLEAECMPLFENFSNKNRLLVVGMNSIVEDEFRLFDLLDRLEVHPNLASALKACGIE